MLFANPTHAQFQFLLDALQVFFGYVVKLLTGMLILLIQIAVYFLLEIANYDGFASAKAISIGWAVVRDLSNMVIVVGLLYIAFSTALGLGKYELDKQLIKLVLVAIGVNFSKTLTLFLVDVSQVVMLTFVHAFSKIGVGNFSKVLGIDQFFLPGDNPNLQAEGFMENAAALVFTVLIMVIVLAVLVVFIGILMARIVAIWIFVVLSPAALLGYAVPFKAVEKIKTQWWDELTKYLMIGPCIAFFIWMTFASFQAATGVGANLVMPTGEVIKEFKGKVPGAKLGAIGSPEKLAGFAVALAMLLGGIKVCSEMASGVAGVGALKGIGDYAKKQLTARNALRFGRDVTAGAARRAMLIPGAAKAVFTKQGRADLGKGMAARRDALKSKVGRGIETVGKLAAKTTTKEGWKEIGAGALKAPAAVLGRAAKGMTYADQLLESPGAIVKGLYRRGVAAEKGALTTTGMDTKAKMFAAADKKIQEQGGRSVDESSHKIPEILSGTSPFTEGESLAESKAAFNNKTFQSPQEEDAFMRDYKAMATAKGWNMELIVKTFDEQKKKNTTKGSIRTEEVDKIDKTTGEMVFNDKAVERTIEKASDREAKTIGRDFSFQEHKLMGDDGKSIHPTVKDEDGKERFDNSDSNFANVKGSILGNNESQVAMSTDVKFKGELAKLLDELVANATLTQEELDQAITLKAATGVIGGETKKSDEISSDIAAAMLKQGENPFKGTEKVRNDYSPTTPRSAENIVTTKIIEQGDKKAKEKLAKDTRDNSAMEAIRDYLADNKGAPIADIQKELNQVMGGGKFSDKETRRLTKLADKSYEEPKKATKTPTVAPAETTTPAPAPAPAKDEDLDELGSSRARQDEFGAQGAFGPVEATIDMAALQEAMTSAIKTLELPEVENDPEKVIEELKKIESAIKSTSSTSIYRQNQSINKLIAKIKASGDKAKTPAGQGDLQELKRQLKDLIGKSKE